MKLAFKIGSIWKIPIELHVTFILLIIAIFILSILPPNLDFTKFALVPQDLYNFGLVLFLFIFVVFHELAHSIVARHYGIRVRKIILYPIGGVSEIEEIPDNPRIEWRMAIAGPATSLLAGAIFLVASLILSPKSFFEIVALSLTVTGNLIFDLATLNILLGIFNLIPAFPMDGGRVFRALLAEKMKFSDATKYAVYLGRIFGLAMIAIGFIFSNYFLLILVGIFVYIGASEEAEQNIISTALAGVRVKDVMQPKAGSVNPEQNLAETVEIMFKTRFHDALVEKDGVFQGTVQWTEITKVTPEQRNTIKVGDMPLKKIFVFDDEAILEAHKIMTREKIDLLPVVERNALSKVVGVLTTEGVANAYEKARNPR